MVRRTENHPLTNRTCKQVSLVSMLLVSGMLLSAASGCNAIRERRAQRAADREDARELKASEQSQAQELPRGDSQIASSQTEWMQRQPIANEQGTPSNPQTDESGQMKIVDDRPSATNTSNTNTSNKVSSDDPTMNLIEPSKTFTKQSKEEQSLARAVELHASGDLAQALSELERAIAFNPQFTLAYLESGDIYLEMADYDRAELQFAMAVRTEPRNFMAQYRHAQVLERLGRLDDSNRAYLRALSIRPADFDANLGISIVLLQLGRTEQALPYGQRAVRAVPPSGRARMHLGNVYAAIDQHEEAIIEYQQAAELMDAPTPGLLLNMAESLNQLDRYAEMVGALDQLVRLEPNAIAYERLGSGLFRLRRYDEALGAFQQSSDIDPTHYPAFNGIAVCELNAYLWSSKVDGGARERAVDAMRKSLRLDRNQPRIVELLRRYKDPSGTEQ